MDKQSFLKILELHTLWLNGNKKGIRADLKGANLLGASLEGTNLRGANLRGANLMGANLRGADLRGANLRGADLRGADLRSADLRSANLMGARFKGADFDGTNVLIFNTRYHTGFLHEYTLTIGCESQHIEHWRKYIKEIGKRHNYSDKDIKQTITLIKCLLKIQKENK